MAINLPSPVDMSGWAQREGQLQLGRNEDMRAQQTQDVAMGQTALAAKDKAAIPGLLAQYKSGNQGALMQIAQKDPKLAETIMGIEKAKAEQPLMNAQTEGLRASAASVRQETAMKDKMVALQTALTATEGILKNSDGEGSIENNKKSLSLFMKNFEKQTGEPIDKNIRDEIFMTDDIGTPHWRKGVENFAWMLGQQIGALQGGKQGESYTLGTGQKRFNSRNQEVASGPEKPPTGMTPVVDPVTGETTFINAKPMPPSVAKQQDTLIGDLRTAAGIKEDLNSIIEGLETGKVDLGLVNNQLYKVQNLGYMDSTPESRNAANLLATLQRMRNDSLRLNKGTQTEGDAVRSWAELLGDDSESPSLPKDNKLLASGLRRIADSNARAEQEKAVRIDTMRAEYGKEALDMSQISNVKPSFEMEEANKSGENIPTISGPDDPAFKALKSGDTFISDGKKMVKH